MTRDEISDFGFELLKKLQAGPAQSIFPDDALHAIFKNAQRVAIEHAESGEPLYMTFFVHGTKWGAGLGEFELISPIVFNDWPPTEVTKEQAVFSLGRKFAQDHPQHIALCLVHVAEVWFTEGSLDTDLSRVTAPSKDPHRTEGIIVSAITLDQRMDYSIHELIRSGGKVSTKQAGEVLHDPSKPTDPRKFGDSLSFGFFRGYFAGREKAEL